MLLRVIQAVACDPGVIRAQSETLALDHTIFLPGWSNLPLLLTGATTWGRMGGRLWRGFWVGSWVHQLQGSGNTFGIPLWWSGGNLLQWLPDLNRAFTLAKWMVTTPTMSIHEVGLSRLARFPENLLLNSGTLIYWDVCIVYSNPTLSDQATTDHL